MTAVDDLAAIQSTNGKVDPIAAAEQIATIWGLEDVGVQIRGAGIFGTGSRAPVEIYLSNDDTMEFESIRDMTRPANLAAELVAWTGATPKLNQAQAVRSVALIRSLGERQQMLTDNEIATDWGASYLQAADTIDVDINDQQQRWAAFERFLHHDPLARAKEDGTALATANLVLSHTDGTRLVRVGWFYAYVRSLDLGIGQGTLAGRMSRVGWTRRGGTGRIKATAPGRSDTRGWNFWTVPPGWEDDR
jgi:hypothetical protein